VLKSTHNLLVTPQSKNKWEAVSSTKPQNEQDSSISEYLDIEKLTGYIL